MLNDKRGFFAILGLILRGFDDHTKDISFQYKRHGEIELVDVMNGDESLGVINLTNATVSDMFTQIGNLLS